MAHIHWFPGHIAKAQRDLKEKLSLVDVVVEVLDARIPYSSAYKNVRNLIGNKSRLILLNKADLSDPKLNKLWAQKIEEESCAPVIVTDLNNQKDINTIVDKIVEIANPIMLELVKKGLLPRAARTMVIGMPNVGKSSTINRLIRKGKAKTGAKRKLIDYRKTPPKPYNMTKIPNNVWYFNRVRYKMAEYENHPTQKPERLLQRIILASSNKGDVVLDPFAGSFTTCKVALDLGRKSIGIENNEEFYTIGLRRCGIAQSYKDEILTHTKIRKTKNKSKKDHYPYQSLFDKENAQEQTMGENTL